MILHWALGGFLVTTAEDVFGVARCESAAVVGGDEFVLEADHAGVGFADFGADDHFFVVDGGRAVAAVGFGYDQQDPVFLLHIPISQTSGAPVFDSADFHPDEVVGVVDDAHLVGFGVADADAGFDVVHCS